MPEAPREQALETIAAILRTMTGPRFWAEPGMPAAEQTYPNPITVLRHFVVPGQQAQFPIVCVIDGSGSRRDFGTTGGIGVSVDHFVAMLYGYVLGNDRVTRSQALERLRYDMYLTLSRVPMPIGNIRNFDFGRPEDTDQGSTEPIGAVQWPVEAVIDDRIEAA